MARFSAGSRSTGAGSTTLPIGSLYGSANGGGHIREIGVTNTTAVAVALKLVRLSTAGTATGISESFHDGVTITPACAAFNVHSSTPPTIANDLGYNTILGAAVGAACIWTFGGEMGLVVPGGTGNGIGIIIAVGTGQICDYYFVWDE